MSLTAAAPLRAWLLLGLAAAAPVSGVEQTCGDGSQQCGADETSLLVAGKAIKRHSSGPVGPMWKPSDPYLNVDGHNNQGNNIAANPSYPGGSQQCQQECDGNADCKYWTFVSSSGECWLKDSALPPTEWQGDDVVSGYGVNLVPGSQICAAAWGKNSNNAANNIGQAEGWYKSADLCCYACHGQPDCTHWTWIKDGQCWLKRGAVPDASEWTDDSSAVSGYPVTYAATPPPTPAPPVTATCSVGARVQCYSTPGSQMCEGNQCCHNTQGSGTVTCPSASVDHVSGCTYEKPYDCTPP